MRQNKGTPGAQSVRRALQLLRVLAQHQEEGIRLPDIVAAVQLERSTVHRLLSCLVEEQFAYRDEKVYRLGVEAMQLGFASMRHVPLLDMTRTLVRRLARLSGDTVFLVVREGDYCRCLHREAGHFPVKVFTMDVGGRRLLGLGAGGLALMAFLEDAEIERIYARHEEEYRDSEFSYERLMQAVRDTRASNYADITDTLTLGVSGIGAAFAASENTTAAISFGGITPRLSKSRKAELATLLISELDDTVRLSNDPLSP